MDEPIKIEEWSVRRFYHDRRRVAVLSGGEAPGPWLAKLRRVLPVLEGRSPAELLAEVRRSGRIELGMVDGREAWKMGEVLREAGYEVEVVDASRVGHLAIHHVGPHAPMALVMEDDEEAEAFCLDLIARGARVEEVEG
ncbi:hypothetical protein [Luteolibacter soli]|uniref:DUF2007 domain-containing protein n=1 Tax=Luteolibacter soli TaxID=3135280 RepID=A0ABU9AVC6_9BACT